MTARRAQLMGIIRNEIVMQWRRGGLRAMAFMFISVPVLLTGVVLTPQDMLITSTTFQALSAEQVREVWTAMAILDTAFLVPMLACIVTVLAAETIAVDRHYGVSEVIGSLPVTPGVYAAGKLLGVWLPLAALLAASVIIIGFIVHLTLGALNAGLLAGYWAVSVLPAGLFMAGLSVLWPARQPTRRRATLVGFLMVPISVLIFMALMQDYFLIALGKLTTATEQPYLYDTVADFPVVLSPDRMIWPVVMLIALAVSWLVARARLQE